MFQLGHTVELSRKTSHVDCPIQEEQERRVLERNDGGDPDIYMGRVLKTEKRLKGVLEIATEDFKEENDHKNSYPQLAEEFENPIQD